VSSGRELAVRVLVRVTDEGAFASRALDAELTRAELPAREAAFATELVYGTLRVLPALDAQLAAHLHKGLERMDPLLRATLRCGAYQLFHLARVPAHAAVDESVKLVRRDRGPKLAGVANAVLRKLAAARPAEPKEPERLVLPGWLEASLLRALGSERLASVLLADATPPLSLRVAVGLDREQIAAELQAARPHAQVALGRLSPRCLLLRRAGDPRALPGYAEGRVSVQEQGAQLVALSLGAQPGERVADLCAGHGGKTAWLADAVGEGGQVLAVDLDPRKLDRLALDLARQGIAPERVERRAIDLTVGVGGLEASFDRVLVDAPCSGLGTLLRRPELLLRVRESDLARLAELQRSILRNARKLVRPGGLLLYAVCSPMREEGAEVAERLEYELPELTRVREPLAGLLAGLAPDPDGVARLGPWLGEPSDASPDAYQIAAFRTPA
jgi:16S rRNA (cytosine967-C5)-methyltransferase